MTVRTKVEFEGPFFAHDPKLTFRQNVRVWADAVAAAGEAEVRAEMAAGQSGRAPIRRLGDRVADHAVGRTHGLSGKRWAVSAVVSVNNSGLSRAEGISLMAAASRVERTTHAFRRVRSAVGRSRGTNIDELLKGIA